jgi:hypothetical protein
MSYSFDTYRGVNTSLYNSLSKDAIQWVELTIWLRMTGRMEAARRIFDDELYTIASTPIVIIERANLEHEAGKWGRAWHILNAAIEDLKQAKADLGLPEHRLMALMRAMFGVRHRGDLVSATAELERARQWLYNVQVDEYTDIQVSFVALYRYVLTPSGRRAVFAITR